MKYDNAPRVLVFFLLMLALLTGCASTPYDGPGKEKSDTLLRMQLIEAQLQAQAMPPAGRVIFAGFAMNSQSKAFRGDVLSAEKWVRAIDPGAVVFKLNNPATGQEADWPYATSENIAVVLKSVASLARPQDKVVLLFATHGARDVLSVDFGNKLYPHLNAQWMKQKLADLKGKPTLLLLSACHAGSFVPPLKDPSRIILAAAAAHRSSFGCDFGSSNTFFVDALLNPGNALDLGIVRLMEQAKQDIDGREKAMNLSPPSLPQSFVGEQAKAWGEQSVRQWLSAPASSSRQPVAEAVVR
jgi:hypothetical protein